MNTRRLIVIALFPLALRAGAQDAPPQGPPEFGPAHGTLMIIGGGLRSTELYKRFIGLAGGPDASILLMSPMDRGERNERGEIETIATMPRLVKIEAKVAEESGVAFFNTFQAMGGEGTMARWYAAEPRLVGSDYIHPMPAGAKIVGELLYGALRDGYNEYKLRQLKSRESSTTK